MTGNKKQLASRLTKAQRKDKQLRSKLFPELDLELLWNRKEHDGFSTIPRSMPLICRCLDYLADKGKPLSSTYLALWFRLFDSSFLEIRDSNHLAIESGFTGQRSASAWRQRMKKLEDLGFIECKNGTHDYSYVLVFNPHVVVKRYENELPENLKNLLYQRCLDVGAVDFTGTD